MRPNSLGSEFPAKISNYDKTRNTLKRGYTSYYAKQPPGDTRVLTEHVSSLTHKEEDFANEVPEKLFVKTWLMPTVKRRIIIWKA